jgi:hypothetical protein
MYMFKVCKSVHHHTIQTNQPTRCKDFSSLLLDVYVQLNMFRASSRPSLGARQLQYQLLVLPSERGDSSAVGRVRAGRPVRLRPTALLPPRSKPPSSWLMYLKCTCLFDFYRICSSHLNSKFQPVEIFCSF